MDAPPALVEPSRARGLKLKITLYQSQYLGRALTGSRVETGRMSSSPDRARRVEPSRARGLKHGRRRLHGRRGGRALTGSRVETSSLTFARSLRYVEPSRARGLKRHHPQRRDGGRVVEPSRARGLKPKLLFRCHELAAVEPSRARGLKPRSGAGCDTWRRRALTGSRVETSWGQQPASTSCVRPPDSAHMLCRTPRRAVATSGEPASAIPATCKEARRRLELAAISKQLVYNSRS